MSVLIETSLGDITIDLYTDICPLASENFLKLAKRKYYHFARCAEVQKDFLGIFTHPFKIPVSLNLLEGKGEFFEDEIPKTQQIMKKGLIGTANKGPNRNNSEFFITLTEDRLPTIEGKHTIFGEVVEGLDILDIINKCHLDEKSHPLMHISILHAYVLDDPFPDPEDFEEPNSPEPEDYLENVGEGEDYANMEQVLQEVQDPSKLGQSIKRHQTKTKEVILEMLNDIPDADMKPGDNVLFVCKLNPLTTEEDLQSIFSQFGKIKSCEIVKDWKTIESLQYAFIDFETKEGAEEAYFKMHNCLVDDRRIHVDFSQSMQHKRGKMSRGRVRKQKFYEGIRQQTIVEEPELATEIENKKDRKKRKKSSNKI